MKSLQLASQFKAKF